MNILEEIKNYKIQEVAERRKTHPMLVSFPEDDSKGPSCSMVEYLCNPENSGIISEFKRKSPSKGIINGHSSVEEVTTGYVAAGVSGLSILTDTNFFGGAIDDLKIARKYNDCPILRKDFIVDTYQILEAKHFGADLILLIGDMLDKEEVRSLAAFAKDLGLEVLMEVHDAKPLDYLTDDIDIVGVNNRDLTNFNVDIKTSERLAKLIPDQFVKISESGISDPAAVVHLKKFGFKGFLIGEHFMKTKSPADACAEFIATINELESNNFVS